MSVYPHRPGYKAAGTSQDAAYKIEMTAKTARGRVLRLLRRSYPSGFTPDRIAMLLDLPRLTVRPRVSELSALGLVERTGERRLNDSGMQAWVWRAVPLEGEQRDDCLF